MSTIPMISANQEIPEHLLSKKDQKALQKATADFESVFIKQMMSEMRKTVQDSGLVKKGQGEKIFQDMLDTQYSEEMSNQPGGFGLKEMLYEQMTQGLRRPIKPPVDAGAASPPSDAQSSAAASVSDAQSSAAASVSDARVALDKAQSAHADALSQIQMAQPKPLY